MKKVSNSTLKLNLNEFLKLNRQPDDNGIAARKLAIKNKKNDCILKFFSYFCLSKNMFFFYSRGKKNFQPSRANVCELIADSQFEGVAINK